MDPQTYAAELASPAEWGDEARVTSTTPVDFNVSSLIESTPNGEYTTPPLTCEPHCKCVTCRTTDFEVYSYAVSNAELLDKWMSETTAQLEKTNEIARCNTAVLEDVQDKYAGESFENRELFIHGIIDGVLRNDQLRNDQHTHDKERVGETQ